MSRFIVDVNDMRTIVFAIIATITKRMIGGRGRFIRRAITAKWKCWIVGPMKLWGFKNGFTFDY